MVVKEEEKKDVGGGDDGRSLGRGLSLGVARDAPEMMGGGAGPIEIDRERER